MAFLVFLATEVNGNLNTPFPLPLTQIVATHAIFCYKSTTDKVLFHD